MANDVQQMRRAQHPRDQFVLTRQVLLAKLVLHPRQRYWDSVLPLREVLCLGTDRADARLVITRRNHELIRVEETLGTLIFIDLSRGFALV